MTAPNLVAVRGHLPPGPARDDFALVRHGHVPFTAVAIDVDGDVQLTPVRGQAASLEQWTTMFHLAVVVLDPFTYESSWIIDTARRIMSVYSEADCRVGFIVTGTLDEARQFMGPLVNEYLVLADPEREAVKAMGLDHLPAFVHLNQNHAIETKAEGWNPEEWRAVAERLTVLMDWRRPQIPAASDPVPFEGTPALR
jgi:hypothetical protein